MKRVEIAMIVRMAFRNLGRHRIKTVITTIAIAVSVGLFIFIDAWMLGMNMDSRRNIVIYEMGAVKIQTPAYFSRKDDLPMYENFGDWQSICDELDRAGYASAPRFVFTGTLYSRTGSAPLLVNAIDTERERKLLRYPEFIDFGHFPENGSRHIVIGINAAEKLHVGLPQRPDSEELENELIAAAADDEERSFIRSLYVALEDTERKKGLFEAPDDAPASGTRYALRESVSHDELQRFWNILSRSGRMDVRISTTIDMKALPERIMGEKFSRDIAPLFTGSDREALNALYELDPVLQDYILRETPENEVYKEKVLAILLESDYSGAVRHVNQLIDAVVVGVVNSPNPKTNSNIAFIPLDSLQDESGLMLDGRVTEILIRSQKAKDSKLPGDNEKAEAVLAALNKSAVAARFKAANSTAVPELAVFGWELYAADYFAASAGDNVSSRIMILFLFVLSFIGIANTMLMAILERTKEIGMLRALGMSDAQLLLCYMSEAAFIGLIGGALGVALGCLINIPMVNIGIDYSAMTKQMQGNIGYRIAAEFKSAWNYTTIVASFFAATLLSGCMAILPTLHALKMPVTETLRFE